LEVIEVKYSILLVSGLALATILLTSGCGQKTSDNPTTTSIGGGNAASVKSKDLNPAQSEYEQKHPKLLLDTSLGGITLQLDAEKAQMTVANFLEYADAGLYDQTIIHQVYKDQAILAGGYTANLGEIRPKRQVRNEADNGLKNKRKSIGMLRQPDVIDSATSQFYINLVDNPALDNRTRDLKDPQGYGYCVFGEVVDGMDVVDKIANTQVQDTDKFDRTPIQAVVIKSVRRVK
jgi:cyclophilin family peptidyl-prolyl cis-trans isomerase